MHRTIQGRWGKVVNRGGRPISRQTADKVSLCTLPYRDRPGTFVSGSQRERERDADLASVDRPPELPSLSPDC